MFVADAQVIGDNDDGASSSLLAGDSLSSKSEKVTVLSEQANPVTAEYAVAMAENDAFSKT
jgi:hypothetical protein